MSAPTFSLKITKGKTLEQHLLYAEPIFQYFAITALISTAPVRVAIGTHGIPDGWLVRIQGVSSPSALNTPKDEWWVAHVNEADQIEINDLDVSLEPAFEASGSVVCKRPADITDWVVRMHVRDKIGGSVLLSLSSDVADGADGVITVDAANSSFVLGLTAAQTAALTWAGAVYDIEGTRPDGAVVSIIAPSVVTVSNEVTVWA